MSEERIVHTVEAFQALEAAVEKMGRDYVEPGASGAHWFAYGTDAAGDKIPADSIASAEEYGCLLGHWMGELGLTVHQAALGLMPSSWEAQNGAISALSDVRVSPEVAKMLKRVPDMNDSGMRWGDIIDRIRANSIPNAPILDLVDSPIPVAHDQVSA